jgi:hypothetical protein
VEIYADHNQTEIWMEAYNCTTPYNIATPYFISIETSDQYWGRQGDEIMVWKSYDDAKRFNLRTFAKANGMDLLCGNYYRVKLATSQPTWTSKLMLIHIDDCDNDPEFTINQEVRTDYTPVIVDFNDHAMLNAWGSVSCYDDSYYSLSVQKCDSSGQYPYGTKVYEVLDDIYTNYMGRPASTNYSEGWLSNFDVTVFSGTRGLPVSSGDYYLVTLCTENLQTQKCKEMVIYKDYIKSVDVDFIKFLLHFVLAEVMVFVFL